MIGTSRGEVVLVWPAQAGETYVEDGAVGARGEDRTKQEHVAHRHLLDTDDMQFQEKGYLPDFAKEIHT